MWITSIKDLSFPVDIYILCNKQVNSYRKPQKVKEE
jgi:hypothetical protein